MEISKIWSKKIQNYKDSMIPWWFSYITPESSCKKLNNKMREILRN